MSWQTYVNSLVGDATNRVVSDRADVSEGTVSRWRTGKIETPDAAQAAALARGFGRPVLEAFVAAGFLSPDEANERPAAVPSFTQLSDQELLDQVAERMRRGRDGSGNTAPITRAGNARGSRRRRSAEYKSVTAPERANTHAADPADGSAGEEFDPEEHGFAARRTDEPSLGERVEEEDQERE